MVDPNLLHSMLNANLETIVSGPSEAEQIVSWILDMDHRSDLVEANIGFNLGQVPIDNLSWRHPKLA